MTASDQGPEPGRESQAHPNPAPGSSGRVIVRPRFRAAFGGVPGQTGLFTLSLMAASLTSAVCGIIVARSVSTAEFGLYSFSLTFLNLLALVFEFGLFFPAARIAVKQGPEERRQTVAATLVLFVPVAVLYGVTLVALSPVVDHAFRVHAGGLLLAAAPLAFVLPFRTVAQWIAQGTDHLNAYSIATLGAGVLAVIFLLVWRHWLGLDATEAVLIQLVTAFAVWLLLIGVLRPQFKSLRSGCRKLVRHAGQYGAQIWIGRVFSVGTYQLDVMMLAGLGSPATVGYYVLAGAIGNGATLPVMAFGTASFGRLARRSSIPIAYLAGCWVAGLACAGAAVALAGPLISLVYSHRYLAAAPLVLPLALAATLRVVTNLYNNFLAAHGEGRALRDAGAALTVSNVVLNVTLIPAFGAPGAAWASFGALAVNYLAHVWGYRRSRRRPTGQLA